MIYASTSRRGISCILRLREKLDLVFGWVDTHRGLRSRLIFRISYRQKMWGFKVIQWKVLDILFHLMEVLIVENKVFWKSFWLEYLMYQSIILKVLVLLITYLILQTKTIRLVIETIKYSGRQWIKIRIKSIYMRLVLDFWWKLTAF